VSERTHKRILFLCTGNYYRSRFAECLFNSIARAMRLRWTAWSCGLALERGANNVGPMAVSAIEALDVLGVRGGDAVGRFPVQVTTEELARADRIVALKQVEHLPLLQERFPSWAERIEYWHIDDAPGVLGLIEQEVMDLVAQIVGSGKRRQGQIKSRSGPWFVYIIRCADGTFYTGITKDMTRRCQQHNKGTASRYTRSRLPIKLVWQEKRPSQSSALKREAAIKAMTRPEKMALIRTRKKATQSPLR
jgi:protein-tyrosine phosphatase